MQKDDSLGLDQQGLKQLWLETCENLKTSVSPLALEAWGKTSQLQEISDFEGSKWLCVINCPSAFNALQFEKNISNQAKQALTSKLGRPIEFKFNFSLSSPSPLDASNATANQTSPSISSPPAPLITSPSITNTSAARLTRKKNPVPQLDNLFSDNTIKQTIVSRSLVMAKNIGLRSDFTFKTFAVSDSNEMPHMAALSVAKNPGINYNPLFLYGNVGVGKTHLMQAIGNYLISHAPETKIVYCTGEDFTNAIIQAIYKKQTQEFREKYRGCDVLLIDDIQFIAGKDAVQAEFFHTFNALVKANKQIVLTSDRPPSEISLLEDRIRSRFEAGLNVDIQQPSFELRSAILLNKALTANLSLPLELAQTIASRIDSARKLEGIISRLKSEVELKGRALDQNLINDILGQQQQREYALRPISPKEIINSVASYYHLKPKIITGSRRQKEIIKARHLAMFLLKAMLNLSYSEIGQLFSNRDHTSVLHGVNKICQAEKKDPQIQTEILALKNSLLRQV